MITDPTGGCLFRIPAARMENAFDQIGQELWSQFLLTFYVEEPPERKSGEVRVEAPGRKGVEVRSVLPVDLVE